MKATRDEGRGTWGEAHRVTRLDLFRHVPRPSRRAPRSALTLLEVVISLAIFLIAMVPIWNLVNLGSQSALDTNLQAQASLLCQSKMDSVKAGIEQFNSNGTVTIGAIDWSYSIESSDADIEYLHMVKVTVKYDRPDGRTTEAVLSQFVYDPNQRGSTIAASTVTTTSSTTGGN
jgi:hypothetical protein